MRGFPDIRTIGRANREIISGMLYRERTAKRNPETRGMNLIPLMFLPHKQKLSLKEVSTVPIAYGSIKVSGCAT
jgi:hypothetical protein